MAGRSDLMMKFVLNGRPIAGASTTNLTTAGARSNPLLTGFKSRSMFEIESFRFGSGVIDVPGGPAKYPVEPQPVSFSRRMDVSSTQLIQSCIDRVVFDSATLIKRRASDGQEVFLRLDFYGVLMVGVDWSDDVEVRETCRFICRGTTMSYRPQRPDGSLGGTIARFWSTVPGLTQPPYS